MKLKDIKYNGRYMVRGSICPVTVTEAPGSRPGGAVGIATAGGTRAYLKPSEFIAPAEEFTGPGRPCFITYTPDSPLGPMYNVRTFDGADIGSCGGGTDADAHERARKLATDTALFGKGGAK